MSMEKGNVLDFIKNELTAQSKKNEFKYKYNEWIRKSWGMACIKCSSSSYGPLTFIPTFIYIFGWQIELIPLVIFDIFVLVFLNYWFYKLL